MERLAADLSAKRRNVSATSSESRFVAGDMFHAAALFCKQ